MILGRYLHIVPNRVQFSYGPHGKPYKPELNIDDLRLKICGTPRQTPQNRYSQKYHPAATDCPPGMCGHNSLLVGIKLFHLAESAYWQAKKRLKETFLKSLTCDIAKDLSHSVKPEHLWCGRRVKTIDSSGILMADTGGGSKTWQK
jgi:hypothetical protein